MEKKLCGNQIPDDVIVNEENLTLSIDFLSDGIYFGSGFKIYFISTLWYTNEPANNPESSDMWNEEWNEEVWPCLLNNVSSIADPISGIIMSPNYPNNYPSDANCIWEIMVPDKTELTLIFLSFRTEGCCDTLKIETKESDDKYKEIGQFYGYETPENIVVNKTLIIQFTSDVITEYSGFKIRFTTSKRLSSKNMEYLDGLKIMYQDSRLSLNSYGEFENYAQIFPQMNLSF